MLVVGYSRLISFLAETRAEPKSKESSYVVAPALNTSNLRKMSSNRSADSEKTSSASGSFFDYSPKYVSLTLSIVSIKTKAKFLLNSPRSRMAPNGFSAVFQEECSRAS
jgi:hypothetical protein